MYNIIYMYELCCCLLLWIILLSSSCSFTKVDKTLILSILATYILSIQSFVIFATFTKVNMTCTNISIVLPVLYLAVKLNILTHYTYVGHKK